MSSALASTLARCAVRRARPVLVANPLVAAVATLLAVTTLPLAVVSIAAAVALYFVLFRKSRRET